VKIGSLPEKPPIAILGIPATIKGAASLAFNVPNVIPEVELPSFIKN
jgi:hypothetical protein